MNRGRIFRRRFNGGMDRLQGTAGQIEDKMRDQAAIIAGQAREGLVRGREALVSFERALEKNVRDNPSLYLAAGLALIGLLIAKLIVDQRAEHER